MLPSTRYKWTRIALPQPDRPALDLPAPEGWKAELSRHVTCDEVVITERRWNPANWTGHVSVNGLIHVVAAAGVLCYTATAWTAGVLFCRRVCSQAQFHVYWLFLQIQSIHLIRWRSYLSLSIHRPSIHLFVEWKIHINMTEAMC